MRPNDLVIECFAELRDGQWTAVCIDFSLAAQADTLEEAKRKLHDQIGEYLHDALSGEDREFAGVLLRRKAPLSIRLKSKLLRTISKFRRSNRQPFCDTWPLAPHLNGA